MGGDKDKAAMMAYHADPANAGKLWQPTTTTSRVSQQLPPMIAFPACLWTFLAEKERECWEVLAKVLDMVNAQTPIISSAAGELLMDWLIFGGQCGDDGKSLLAMSVDPCYAYEEVFQEWKEQRLDFALGPKPTLGAGTPTTPQLGGAMDGQGFQGLGINEMVALIQQTTQSSIFAAQHNSAPLG